MPVLWLWELLKKSYLSLNSSVVRNYALPFPMQTKLFENKKSRRFGLIYLRFLSLTGMKILNNSATPMGVNAQNERMHFRTTANYVPYKPSI